MNLFKRHSVSVLDEKWNPIFLLVKVKHIPRAGELVYLKDKNYYRVINVVHNINKKQGIFLVVELLGKDPSEFNK
jgi:hypothetical protein